MSLNRQTNRDPSLPFLGLLSKPKTKPKQIIYISGLIYIQITKSHRAELDKSMPREDKEMLYSQGLGMLSQDCSTLLEVFEEID